MRPLLVDWLATWLPRDLALVLAPTWFTMVGLAGLLTLLLMLRAARAARIEPAVIASAILWGYVAAVVAGIAVPMAIDAVEHAVRDGRPRVHWAGMTSFWGYLAGGVAVALVARAGRVSGWRLADLAAAPLGLALCSARLGCFIAGCDFGKVTSAPWAVRFPSGSPAWRDHVAHGWLPPARAESLPVHPTQLYEAGLGLVIAALALLVARTAWARDRAGRVALAAIAAYAIGRLGIEELRADAGRGFFGPLASGQVFSLLVLAALAAGWAWSRRRGAAVAAVAGAAAVTLALAPGAAHAQPSAADDGATPVSDGGTRMSLGLLAGWSAPLNRRGGQVPPLVGPTVSLGFSGPGTSSLWIDFDSHGNDDASHGTLLVSAQWLPDRPGKWTIGPRVGVGATLVNFDEPAFRDVTGLTVRAEAVIDVELTERWRLWVRPLSFDYLAAHDLGGPILSWQLRIGIGYQQPRARPAPRPAIPTGTPPAQWQPPPAAGPGGAPPPVAAPPPPTPPAEPPPAEPPAEPPPTDDPLDPYR